MKKNWVALPLAGVVLSACVTVNIYFPAAAAEKAADKIIDEVWQGTKSPDTTTKPGAPAPAVPVNQKEKSI
ncbi:hypothetical protein [Candidatus Nitrotoga fabula]|uniref:Lipoprotein n=1 Tax=Candidatus Nitrotoga fabula TaxID=2182327 RepID=A0A916BGU8_9PROT|nr:hypothetical protein [Candidatus Nitrotoga fabula]CAE6722772.1 conserved exported hypothetical protein [Candidatus Nitrotoga fabula]